MRQMLIGMTVLAMGMVGCGASSDPDPSGKSVLVGLAQSIEEEVEVSNARCHPVRGGDGHHFYCLVNVSRGDEFKLGVAVVAGKEAPLITSCEDARAEKSRGVVSFCALPPAGS